MINQKRSDLLDLRENARIYWKKPHVQRSIGMIWHLFANESLESAQQRPGRQIFQTRRVLSKTNLERKQNQIHEKKKRKQKQLRRLWHGKEVEGEEMRTAAPRTNDYCDLLHHYIGALARACARLLEPITFIPIQASWAKISLFSAQVEQFNS